MKIKKYQPKGEEDAIKSVKKIKNIDLFSIAKNSCQDIKSAYDENLKENIFKTTLQQLKKTFTPSKKEYIQNAIKEKEDLIAKLKSDLQQTELKLQKTIELNNKKYDSHILQFMYDILIKQSVLPEICSEILDKIEVKENDNVDFVLKIVYNKILNILNFSKIQDFSLNTPKEDEFAKNVVFLGNTGVGKTTTIAKLSSNLIIQDGLKVGFITADTYRIAAVEQLKVYAEILGASVEVIYSNDEISKKVEKLKYINDIIFFDTAGRSHKNKENIKDIKEFIKNIDSPDIYLVINVAMRFEDMLDVIKCYERFMDFKLIFTKIDESSTLGAILNIAYLTRCKIAYITNGQNVPCDIEVYSAFKIAKVLLGSIYK